MNTIPSQYSRIIGDKEYELKDHLGNIRVTISDEREDNTTAVVTSATSYLPFGMVEPNVFISSGHRYGYNGTHENDNEIAGEGNNLDFGGFGYDPRVGRRWNRDPLMTKYPAFSPYVHSANSPIMYYDNDGKDFKIASIVKVDGKIKIKITFTAAIVNHSNESINAVGLQKEMISQLETNYSKDFKLYNNKQAAELSSALGLKIDNGDVISVEMDANIRIASAPNNVQTGEHKINVWNDQQWYDLKYTGAKANAEFLGDEMNLKSSTLTSIVSSSDPIFTHEPGHLMGLPHVGSRLSSSIEMEYFSVKDNLFNAMFSGTKQREYGIEGLNYDINTPQFVRILSNIGSNKDNKPESQTTLEQKLNEEGD